MIDSNGVQTITDANIKFSRKNVKQALSVPTYLNAKTLKLKTLVFWLIAKDSLLNV